MFKLNKLANQDFIFILLIIIICVIGGITVFSSTYFIRNSVSQIFYNQLLFYIVGIIIFFFISCLDISKLNNNLLVGIISASNIILLLLVLLVGNSAYGAQRWIDVGPFSIQPSEFSKIVVIITSSFLYSYKNKTSYENILNFYDIKYNNFFTKLKVFFLSEHFIKFILSLLFLIITVLLILKQRSLGNSVLIIMIYSLMVISIIEFNYRILIYITPITLGLILSFNLLNINNVYQLFGLNLKIFNIDILLLIFFIIILIIIHKILRLNLFIILLCFFVVLPLNNLFLFTYKYIFEDYQRQRIETFINPSSTKSLNEDYNREKALEAIGSSKLFGSGFLHGEVVNSGLLPFSYTDFAYASFTEQFGFIGATFLLIVYFILLTKILKIWANSKERFFKLISIGVFIMISLNILQHVGMNIGILPITGVPLPLISSGGSSIIIIFIGLGIVNSIDLKNKENFEQITKFLL